MIRDNRSAINLDRPLLLTDGFLLISYACGLLFSKVSEQKENEIIFPPTLSWSLCYFSLS